MTVSKQTEFLAEGSILSLKLAIIGIINDLIIILFIKRYMIHEKINNKISFLP